jgi:hypothetical protein
MSITTTLSILGGNNSYTVVIEPWANEYEVSPHDICRLVAVHPIQHVDFSIEFHQEKRLIVYINNSGSNYEFYRNEDRK